MGNVIDKRMYIDEETGEVLKEKSWYYYDGFNEKGYSYRNRSSHIRYFFDSIPVNLSEESLMLLLMIAEIMNDENVLVYRVERKSKFSSIIYKPLDKDDIRLRTRFRYGMNKFDRCWRELRKKCIKQVRYYDYLVWAVNPSMVIKTKYIPFWLYDDFQDDLNPHLSAITIKKLQEKINSYK